MNFIIFILFAFDSIRAVLNFLKFSQNNNSTLTPYFLLATSMFCEIVESFSKIAETSDSLL